jgi:hypothetical protein
MTGDNGGELIEAEFLKILKSFNIQQWTPIPYTSQQNRKMGHFWGTLDSARGGRLDSPLTDFIVHEYNEV